jgi:hypothetical protein
LVNVYKLALLLRLPVTWLQREAKTGGIPCLRVGHKRRFNAAAVARVLAERAANTYATLRQAGKQPGEAP